MAKIAEKVKSESPVINTQRKSLHHVTKHLKTTTNFVKKISTTQVLVTLLVVASFLIGVLVTKVQYLEKGQTLNNQAAAPSAADQQAQAQQQGLTDGQKVEVDNGKLPINGDANAKVKIVEFSDFECPFCEKFYTDIYVQLKKDYIDTGKVALYFRHFPLDFHASAKPAAIAAECANEQGNFWAYHDLVFKNQSEIAGKTAGETNTALKNFATTLGLNASQFNTCLDNEKYKDNVEKDVQDGSAAGVNGTPTAFINGTAIIGAQPYTAFKTLIDQELSK